MDKCTPDELKNAAEDLQHWAHRHPNVVKAEPDIVKDVVSARDKAFKKYQQVSESPRKRDGR